MDNYLNYYVNLIGGSKNNFIGGNKKFFIGVAGASGCGKTYLSERLRDKLVSIGIAKTEVISCDNYYKSYPGGGVAPNDFNWDRPETLDLLLLSQHLDELNKNEKVNIPKYNFVTSQREGVEKELDGSQIQVFIVEGLFVLFDEVLRSKFNLKIFTLLDPDICLARRLNRDVHERGRDYASTIRQYQEHVKPSYVNFIEPTKRFADIIISTSEYSDTSIPLDMIGNYVITKI